MTMLNTNDPYVEYLASKLNETNDKLSTSINLELSELKDEEKYLQDLLESKAREELITNIETDLAMDSLRTKKLRQSLRNSNLLTQSFNNNSKLIGYLEADLAMDSLRTQNLRQSLRNSNPLDQSLNNNTKLIGYLERDLEIEKLKALNDTINSRTLLVTSATERLSGNSTTDLYDKLLKQSLKNDSLRSHFLVHKPGEECSICSPNSIYINTLRHSSDNLKSFLQKSITPHEKHKKEEPRIAPNVVYFKLDINKKSKVH